MRLTSSSLRRAVGVVAVSGLLAAGGTAAPSVADQGSSSGGSTATGDRAPIFDFSDAFYRTNGIDPAKLVGRRSGTDGLSVPAKAPDANHRDVRVLFTLPAYDTSGKRWFFTVLSDLAPNPFTPNAAGRTAQQLAEASPVYVFPTLTGDPLGVGNSRQADLIDMRHGYFSNNPLGLWVHVFVTWTPKALNTAAGKRALADLKARNGESLDGTPIIKTQSDLDALSAAGYVKLTKRPTTAQGRYFVCPVYKDPRRGAITRDAFLATVRRTDGSPLPAEQGFVDDFNALQTTGEYPR
jgi:hypothetical protein